MKSKFAFKKYLSLKYLIILLIFTQTACHNKLNNQANVKPNATLKNTYWKVVQIGKLKVTPYEDRGELHFILKLNENVVEGHSGCNAFGGQYTISDDHTIQLSKVISTRMYCAEYEVEPTWFDFIEGSLHFEISGDEMTLTNNKKVKAKCQAVYLK